MDSFEIELRNGKIKGFIRFRTSCILSLGFCVLQMLEVIKITFLFKVCCTSQLCLKTRQSKVCKVNKQVWISTCFILDTTYNIRKRKYLINIYYNITLSTYPPHQYGMGGPASTCSRTSAKSQDTEGNSNCGETKKPEGGVLVNNEDSRKNVRVNVSKLINFYNSLSTF